MPIFKTAGEAQTWCSAHFPGSSTPHSWFNPLDHIQALLILISVAAAWVIGKDGVPAVWSGIKSVYSRIRNVFSKTIQPTTTPVA